MILEKVSLARQLDLVFRELKEELAHLTSGTVFVQIRNNMVGKFGVRHFPLESRGSELKKADRGLTESHQHSFRQTALESLKLKKMVARRNPVRVRDAAKLVMHKRHVRIEL